MIKITVNENLVPSRHPFVKGSPYSDLTVNLLYARKLIRAAQFIFQLKKGAAVFSGYIFENADSPLVLRLCENGVALRSLTLIGMGYGGELAIDVEDISQAVYQDVFGGLGISPSFRMAVGV